MILMGVFSTFIMDFLAAILVKRNLMYSFIEPEAIGRWFLYMFRGKFLHKDIHKTPALKNEKQWCLISHYLIGVFLSAMYLLLDFYVPIIHYYVWLSLIFGISTVFLPWFWLLPSIGIGFMASKSPYRSLIIRTNLINHTHFGLGLFIWMVSFHPFFR